MHHGGVTPLSGMYEFSHIPDPNCIRPVGADGVPRQPGILHHLAVHSQLQHDLRILLFFCGYVLCMLHHASVQLIRPIRKQAQTVFMLEHQNAYHVHTDFVPKRLERAIYSGHNRDEEGVFAARKC